MTTEFANVRSRGASTFPGHWTGIHFGQSQADREAAIFRNMRDDAEKRGDRVTAAKHAVSAEQRTETRQMIADLEKGGGRTPATELLRNLHHVDD
jgi:hypothetical protein